jgi:hypothetical protein
MPYIGITRWIVVTRVTRGLVDTMGFLTNERFVRSAVCSLRACSTSKYQALVQTRITLLLTRRAGRLPVHVRLW